jgi:hypothetical protein
MNDPVALADDLRQFIIEKIDSVPHLEALLLIWEHPEQRWTADALAKFLYVKPGAARAIALDLIRHGCIRKAGSADIYEVDASWDRQGDFMRRLATAYRSLLIPITTLIHSKASAAVRDFAKAFQFKKD